MGVRRGRASGSDAFWLIFSGVGMGDVRTEVGSNRVVISRSRREGCAVPFLCVWLTVWTLALVHFLSEPWSPSSWNLLALMGLPEVAALGVLLYLLTGKERLIVGPRGVVGEHSAVVTFDRCEIRIEDVASVELHEFERGERKDHAFGEIRVSGGDCQIQFGAGLGREELWALLSVVRRKVDELRAELAAKGEDDCLVETVGRTGERRPARKVPWEAILLAPAVIVALVYRLHALPWDFGGCFFQVWVSVMGLVVVGALLPRLKPGPRGVAASILLPDAVVLLFGAIRFAPQALLPFVLLALAVSGVCWLWSQSRRRLAAILALALIPIVGDAYFYGLAHMRTVERLRGLSPGEIEEVRIERGGPGEAVVVRDGPTLAAIAEVLGETTPYSPNHEGIREPRKMTIRLVDGSTIEFSVGKGNRAHPETAWIQFGVEVYQNAGLRRLLQTHKAFAAISSHSIGGGVR